MPRLISLASSFAILCIGLILAASAGHGAA
jgi:hypothetical protein